MRRLDRICPRYHLARSRLQLAVGSCKQLLAFADVFRSIAMQRFLVTPFALAFVVASAHAVVLPDDVQAALNQRYAAFVSVEGFSKVDPVRLLKDWDTPARFPHRTTNAVFGSDARINAATRALMLLESREPPLPHVRYRITYRLDNAPDFDGYANAYVEVTRFNLGPVRRADVVEAAPAGVPVAPAEHFGTGPSVSWRFVMGSIQGRLADVIRASRRALSVAEARAMDCLGTPCMTWVSPPGPAGEWRQIEAPAVEPAAYVAQADGIATAARISELLYRQASGGQETIEPLAMHAAEPQLTFVISMDVDGQDHAADGLLHQQWLFDDAISSIWTQRRDAGPGAVQWRQHLQYHPGRDGETPH